MRPLRSWPIYLGLQNATAYGDAAPNPGPAAGAIDEIARGLVARRPRPDLARSLVVGPGGPSELLSLLPALPRPVHALTAHEPEARAIHAALGGEVSAEVGDMHEMPFESGVFGLVYASNVLEHAIAPYAALMQVRRVLADGGTAVLVMPDFEGREGGRGPFHLHCLDRRVWEELLWKCGLPIAETIEQPGGSGEGGYVHYRCVAAAPPRPHDDVLAALVELRRTQGP